MADTKMVKSTGEHWVCSMMSRLGWGVALTRDGLERTDILAVDPHDSSRRMIEVQVKTASGNGDSTNWPLGLKSQSKALSDAEWFVFVILNDEPASTRCFVVPRDHVAAATWISHTSWLTDPDATPGTRNTPIKNARVYMWVFERYEDKWDLMEAPATEAPVLLPAEFRDYALDKHVGLPTDHPWNAALPDW